MKKCIVLAGMILLFAVGAFAQSRNEKEDLTVYDVVVNHEEQYSIWPADKELPLGWMKVGFKGKKEACLAHIKEVWTDMRPLSLRKKMEEIEREKSKSENAAPEPSPKPQPAPAAMELKATEDAAQPEAPAPLDAEAVSALLEELKGRLSDFIDADDNVTKITEKWQTREDLAGQTKKRVLELLFEDVKSVIADEEVRKAIWDNWNPDAPSLLRMPKHP
jgi:MbtH protein